MEKTKFDLKASFKKLSAIADWFDNQKEVDVEEGLSKVKEAAGLITETRKRLHEIENEFEEIKEKVEKN
ncbi:exodeoxyribonuclease VII small subunit [Candidatus Wolfebacteria bacterium]|nr:exodeoxyribonuclease VII small subunit [Candidatus Wolfebacteria bacterium]